MDEEKKTGSRDTNPPGSPGGRDPGPGNLAIQDRRSHARRDTNLQPGFMCRFAADNIFGSLEKFLAESAGVREGGDIEPLHRMRVASRRLRAGLRTFKHCIPPKRYQRIYSETRAITRALGEARDADVQIAFLKKARKKASSTKGRKNEGENEVSAPLLDAISYLIGLLRKERSRCQKDVLGALDKVEKRNLSESLIQAGLSRSEARSRRRRVHGDSGALVFLAADNIGRCYADLMAYEPWLEYPDATAEHHAMRIAAKNLRYTMEIFAPVYRIGLRKYITRVARLQKLLGDLHDTDVWIDMVTRILLKERSRPRSLGDLDRPGPAVIAGLRVFQNDRERERRRVYRRTVQYWNSLHRMHFWDALTCEVLGNHRAMYLPKTVIQENMVKERVMRAMHTSPESAAHSLHVASLSLQIFDQLMESHHLSEKERRWLEFGALLHDIGFKEGKKGHAKRSALLISTDEQIPFSLKERGVIGLLAHSHRGSGTFERSGYYRLLTTDEQQSIRMLAGILRVADGLDGTHRGKAASLACTRSDGGITLLVSASSDCSREISMALSKASLFEHTFMKILKIEQAPPAPGPAGYPEGLG